MVCREEKLKRFRDKLKSVIVFTLNTEKVRQQHGATSGCED